MIADLKPHAVMKESGVEWLGEIPQDWELRRMKTLLRERVEKGFPGEPLLAATQSRGVVRKEHYENRTVVAQKDLHLLKLVRVGDFVISLRSFQGGIEYAREQGIISPAYTVLYPRDSGSHAFLAWLFKCKTYVENLSLYVTGIRQGQNIDYKALGRSMLPVPPLSEQSAISHFLEYADRRIRACIRSKQRLAALLKEKKQVVIYRAVVHGLDSSVRLKPSQAEWFGTVPHHWAVLRLKQVSLILRGRFSHRPRNDPSLYGGPFPFLQTGDVARARKFITHHGQSLNERGLGVSKLFPAGTLVMTIAANIGDVAILDFDACFPDSVVGLLPGDQIDRDYLYFVCLAMRPELIREAPVNTQGNLNVERIGVREVPVPPRDEQRQIVRYLEKVTRVYDLVSDRTRHQISLLQEYRARLIADVVTGKLDVRNAVMDLANEMDESMQMDESNTLSEEGISQDDLDPDIDEAVL